MRNIVVGCCGIPVARSKYFGVMKAVELQNTFYDLPTEEEASRLRQNIPENVVVTIKAWQVITHPHTSPTWRKMKRKPTGKLENYGLLKPSRENLEAWNAVLKIARILKARAIVLQTPPSFRYSEENLKQAIEFFRSIDRNSIIIAWEPRGDWHQHRDAIKKVVDLGIIHITDPLREDPVSLEILDIGYARLHGLGPREVNYRYKYTDEDLERLSEKVLTYLRKLSTMYIMFNNIYMFDDALRFKQILSRKLAQHMDQFEEILII